MRRKVKFGLLLIMIVFSIVVLTCDLHNNTLGVLVQYLCICLSAAAYTFVKFFSSKLKITQLYWGWLITEGLLYQLSLEIRNGIFHSKQYLNDDIVGALVLCNLTAERLHELKRKMRFVVKVCDEVKSHAELCDARQERRKMETFAPMNKWLIEIQALF